MENGRYDDIICLPHRQSEIRPHMPRVDRAAQFSPFAALTGYEAAVQETARLTETRIELTEAEKAVLDEKLRIVRNSLKFKPEITITWFQPDDKKAGGKYAQVKGVVKRIDSFRRTVIMLGNTSIPIDDIFCLESELFASMEVL